MNATQATKELVKAYRQAVKDKDQKTLTVGFATYEDGTVFSREVSSAKELASIADSFLSNLVDPTDFIYIDVIDPILTGKDCSQF